MGKGGVESRDANSPVTRYCHRGGDVRTDPMVDKNKPRRIDRTVQAMFATVAG